MKITSSVKINLQEVGTAAHSFVAVFRQVMGEIEAKSELVREQDREFNRVQAAHEQIAASLAIITSENRQHIARINQLEAEARRGANERRCVTTG